MTTERVRLTPEQRKAVILNAAITLTKRHGSAMAWTRKMVAEACETPTSEDTVKLHYSMSDLRAAARRAANTPT